MSWDYVPLIEAVRARVDAAVGAAPPEGGVALVTNGVRMRQDMAGCAHIVLRLNMNCKAGTQRAGLSLLAEAQRAAARMRGEAGGWQIVGCSVVGAPESMGQDTQGWYLFSAAVEISAFCSGGE